MKEQGLDMLRQSWVDVDLMILQQNPFNPEAGTLDNVLLAWSLVTQRQRQRTYNETAAL